jgi:cytochrome c-type biogenesis protein CcmH/NrfG
MKNWLCILLVAIDLIASFYTEGNSALEAYTESNYDDTVYSNYYFRDAMASKEINWNDIVAEMSAAIKADPTNASAHERLAAAYAATGRIQEALKSYSTAIHLNPTNWENFSIVVQFIG